MGEHYNDYSVCWDYAYLHNQDFFLQPFQEIVKRKRKIEAEDTFQDH